ncbi:MAG TPA: TNT domain-containing protein, partial [Microbacterium sp.]|nr:TNT domain-containing protein [Microbacterium sp.]
MPDVSITPSTMSIDAQSLDTLATSLDNIASTLRSSLSGTEGMAGDDETGRAFAHGTDEFTSYDTAGTNTLNAVYTAAGFLRSFEALVSNTGRAYDNATFAATDAGGESSIAAITAPASATSSSVPSAEGAGSHEWLRNLGWIGEGIEMVLDKLRAAVAPTLTPSRLTPPAGGNGGQPPAADGTTTDPGRSDDPTINRDAEGDGWRREQDLEPVDPEYGTPQSASGALDPDARYASNTPAPDVADVNPAMRDLLDGYPEAPYGRDEHGTPLTREQFEARYVDADGNLRYPPNAGAVPGSIVTFESVDAFRAVYGDVRLDRIGNERGRYFSIEGTPFRERALPPGTLRDTYATMGLTSLPPNARIEVSRIAPAFGQPGGGLQIRILDMDSLDGNGWYNAYNQAGLAAPEVGALQNVESHVPQTDAAPAAADAKPAN